MYLQKAKDFQGGRQKCISQRKEKLTNVNIDTQLSKARKSTKSNANMTKFSKKNKCSEGCRKHEFEIKPVGYSVFLSKGITEPMTLNFCFKGNSTTIPIPIIPLQLSKQPQVPLFILDEQIHRYQFYIESHRQQFEDAINKARKAMQSEYEEEIIIAIPKTKNCQICRLKIDSQSEYERHLENLEHKQAIKKSLGQKYIMEATLDFEYDRRVMNEIEQKLNQVLEISLIMKEAKKTLKALLKRK